MTIVTTPKRGDPRLRPFLDAAGDHDAGAALEALLDGEIDRLVRDTVRRALGDSQIAAADVDDVVGDVRVSLVRKLWSLRRGAGEPIENFSGYVVNASENGCCTFLRTRHPERTRFRNRVRYAVAHHPGTSMTRDEHGLWRCETRRAGPRAAGALRAFLERPREWFAAMRLDAKTPIATLVDDVLARVGEGVEFNRLVDALAIACGVVDRRPVSTDDDVFRTAAAVPDPAPAAGDVLQQREALLKTWSEIAELPVRQRAALLLNLRDPEGGAILQMLPSTGVVSEREIAEALAIDPAELSALWPRLPLDDLAIAERLHATRQQVINLRKTARARLMRRLKPSFALRATDGRR